VHLLLVAVLAACGSGSGEGLQPAATATPRPTPGCGNGIIDQGEFCDGESFCTNCQLTFLGGCCALDEPDGGTVCVEMSGPSPHACVDSSGSFSVGTSCEGSSCDEGFCRGDGRCVSHPIEPTSLCCQLDAGGCTATVSSDTGALATFFIFSCDSIGLGKSSIGTCGDDGICTRR
jgi:hypothetical protein